jgi:hypothetical protein
VKIQADNLHLQALLHGNDPASVDPLRAREIPAATEGESAAGGAAHHRDPGEDVLAFDAWSGSAARTLSTTSPGPATTLDAAGLDRLAEHILAPLA